MLFYSSGILLAVLAVFGRVQWALLLVVFLIPLRNIVDKVQQFPMGTQFLDILFAGMILGWIFPSLFSNKIFSSNIF